MKLNLLIVLFIIISFKLKAQNSVSGTVFNENQIALYGVLVVNINTDKQTFTDEKGHFLINAISGNELRFIRKNYERISLKVNQKNDNSTLKIELKYLPKEIEAVVLNYKPTGNLTEDSKHFGASKKDIQLSKDLGKYIHQYSAREIMKHKPGEFVQPRETGFETIKIGYQWKPIEVPINFEVVLGDDYFVQMGIEKSLIFSFINFVLKDFDTENIRRFGRITSSDLARFQAEAERQIGNFKNQSIKKK
jgi:hypothetical protein